ncbi:hypothetical protein [Candidatus Electrothrix sp.]|uniref:hypothetical protein n=1 Tax=Candidatus Electrothrix sp. TaxID=2170559 RepID=UPI004055CA1C
MESLAFETVIRNGMIAIPEQYRERFQEPFRIIVHLEPLTEKQGTDASFNAARISTKGFKFNRDEANERESFL